MNKGNTKNSMNSEHTYSFYNESVCGLGLPVQPNHRPNNPVPEANAEFTILIPTYKYRPQTHFQISARAI